jgi:hypothetical protein
MSGTLLLVGTRKGLWIGRSDEARLDWSWTGPHFAMTDTHESVGLYFGGRNGAVWASADDGDNWREIVRNLPDITVVRAYAGES